jgi:cytoskeletal protein CcmA (bactofilin family)
MWKKTKDENPKPKSPPLGKSPIEQLKEQAVIGPSISIKGELSGEEDLMIQGRVEGKIDLKKNNVTVGRTGPSISKRISTERLSVLKERSRAISSEKRKL